MRSIKDILLSKTLKKDYRNKHEYQAYGNRLAEELRDMSHRSLYIKLAKTEDRNLLEAARAYVLGSEKATTKGRLFMWKLTQLKTSKKDGDQTEKTNELPDTSK